MTENNGSGASLRDLLTQGKQKGSLTTKEITDVLEELNLTRSRSTGFTRNLTILI